MAELHQVDLGNGMQVWVASEVNVVAAANQRDAALDVPKPATLLETLTSWGELLKEFVKTIQPNEFDFELDFEWDGTVGWFVAQSSVKATVKATFKWQLKPAPK